MVVLDFSADAAASSRSGATLCSIADAATSAVIRRVRDSVAFPTSSRSIGWGAGIDRES